MHPSVGTGAGVDSPAKRASPHWFCPRVQAPWNDHLVCCLGSSHRPSQRRAHRKVHFHFTPTHSSWLNQVECWFSILSRQALRGASFTSPQQVREAIDRFVAAHNQKAHPFEWTKTEVRQQDLQAKVGKSDG